MNGPLALVLILVLGLDEVRVPPHDLLELVVAGIRQVEKALRDEET